MSDTYLNEGNNLGEGVWSANAAGHASESSADPIFWGLKRSIWIQIGIIAVLFCGLFWPNLRRLWDKTNPFYGEANWGHAICIPIIGLYYLYVNRERLLHGGSSSPTTVRRAGLRVWLLVALSLTLPLSLVFEEARRGFMPVAAVIGVILVAALIMSLLERNEPLIHRADEHSAGWFGGVVMLFGIGIFQYAIYPGQNDFLKDFGMVVTLFGVVLALAGWSVMKIAWFPIAFLVCGIPWPGLVYSRVAGPLQQLAATVAVWTLQLTGVEASVGGTKISMVGGDGNWRTLNVAEACAGMRSLMTFISVAAAVAFLSSRPLWQKIIVVLFAVPIAIFCNVMRVSGQGLLDRYVSHSLSENFAHQFVGLIMLIPAFLLILLVGWILDQVFYEEIDRRFVAMAPKVITRNGRSAGGGIGAPAGSAKPRGDQSVDNTRKIPRETDDPQARNARKDHGIRWQRASGGQTGERPQGSDAATTDCSACFAASPRAETSGGQWKHRLRTGETMSDKQIKTASSRGLVQPAFVVVSAILLLSVIAFNGFVWNLKLHFKKEAVPQPREFREMPQVMGHWMQVSQDDKLDKETEDVLGTEKYIYRDYIQVDRAGADLLAFVVSGADKMVGTTRPSDISTDNEQAGDAARAAFAGATFDKQVKMINDALAGRTPMERKEILSEIEVKGHSGDVVHLGLTYYTGLVDTVAHIPDRCYIADGYESSSFEVPSWNVGTDASGKPKIMSVRFMSFQDSTGNNRVSKCVAYVFNTNGHFESDPLGVRQTLEDLTERYGYYAKIEMMTLVPSIEETDDITSAKTAMTEFLTAALPQIETCLPDWNKVKQSHS